MCWVLIFLGKERSPHPGCKLNTANDTLVCAALGYFVLIHFQSFRQPLGCTVSKAFQMKSAMQQIVIFDADNYPGLLQMSFKVFSYFLLPSFQLKVNKGQKEISLIENSFSFQKGKRFSFLPLHTFSLSRCFLLHGVISCLEEICVSLPASPNTPWYRCWWLKYNWGRGQWKGKFFFVIRTTSHNLSGI